MRLIQYYFVPWMLNSCKQGGFRKTFDFLLCPTNAGSCMDRDFRSQGTSSEEGIS
jgi:hypothetical protein